MSYFSMLKVLTKWTWLRLIVAVELFRQEGLRGGMKGIRLMRKTKLEFEQPICPKRQDSLWFGGAVMTLHYRGYQLHLSADGDIRAWLWLKGTQTRMFDIMDRCNLGALGDELFHYIKSDKELRSLLYGTHPLLEIEIQDGNCFNLSLTDPAGEYWDLGYDVLYHDQILKLAAEVILNMDEHIRECKEETYLAA